MALSPASSHGGGGGGAFVELEMDVTLAAPDDATTQLVWDAGIVNPVAGVAPGFSLDVAKNTLTIADAGIYSFTTLVDTEAHLVTAKVRLLLVITTTPFSVSVDSNLPGGTTGNSDGALAWVCHVGAGATVEWFADVAAATQAMDYSFAFASVCRLA